MKFYLKETGFIKLYSVDELWFVFSVLQHFIPKLLTSVTAPQNVDKANGSQHKFRETTS